MAAKQKFIKVPNPILLCDPLTGAPLKDNKDEEVTFKDFVMKLMSNPIWMESYPRVRSANAIMEQLKLGKSVMVLDEEDWNTLKGAAENPKQLINNQFTGAQTVTGYGWIPTCVPQLLPFIEAIVNASDKEPSEN